MPGEQTPVTPFNSPAPLSYVIISPVRNEAAYIEKTLRSVTGQTVKPAQWIIVDDGSSDETVPIISEYVARCPWIKLVGRADRGKRQRGKGVIEAFYEGFSHLSCHDYDLIVKLDGDLSFDEKYFEALLRQFQANPALGIAGGGVYERLTENSAWSLQAVKEHVRGPTKVYRRACFDDIGGLEPALGWDGLDEWKAKTRGWQVETFLELKVYHHRPTGAATGSLKAPIEKGYGAYYMAYHPLYLIASGLLHMVKRRPYVLAGLAMILAFFAAGLKRRERITDKEVIAFIRRTQWEKLKGLLAGKPVYE